MHSIIESSGLVQTYMQPLVSLKVESTNRTVMEIQKPMDVTATAAPPSVVGSKYLLEFDYPLSIFLAFSILCAVEFYRVTRDEALPS